MWRRLFEILNARFVASAGHAGVRGRGLGDHPLDGKALANARESVKEPGVARFDVVQQQDDPTRFVLVEVYRDANAAVAHKETKHYPIWRDAVAPMMAEPRQSVKFSNVFPDEAGW